MVTRKNASRLGGITVAMGLGVAVTTGHGVASADSTTDGEGQGAQTTSAPPETSPTEQTKSSDSTASSASAARRTAQQRRAAVRTALREQLSVSPRHVREETTHTADSPDGVESRAKKKVVERKNDGATLTATATAPRVRQQAEKPSQVETPARVTTRKQVTTPVRAALTRAQVQPAAEGPTQTSAPASSRVPSTTVSPSPSTGPKIAAVPAPLAAADRVTRPVSVLTNLLAEAGFRPNAITPGAPGVPTPPRLLELAYAAWRRVVVPRFFNSTPTATVTVDYDDRDESTGKVSGAVIGRDADQDKLTYEVARGPATGTLDFHDDGTFTYAPDQDLAHQPNPADVTFTVQVSDEASRPHLHLFSRTQHTTTATVTIDIDQLNKAPAITVSDPDPQADGTIRFTVSPTDDDVADQNSLEVTWTDPAHGSVAPVTGMTNVYAYTPETGYPHTLSSPTPDPFTFVVTDQFGKTGSVEAKPLVQPVNTAPVVSVDQARLLTGQVAYKLTAADADADTVYVTVPDPSSTATKGSFDKTGVVAIAPGEEVTLIYTPDPSTVHTMPASTDVTFQFVGDDRHAAGVSQPATVTTTFNPVNRPADVTVTTRQLSDSKIEFTVTAADLDRDSVTVTAPVLAPAIGSFDVTGPVTLTDGQSQTFVFTPNEVFAHGLIAPTGRDFAFALNDGLYQGAATEHVNATVQPDNDAPALTVGNPVKQSDGSYTIALSVTDNDLDSVRVSPPVLTPTFGSWQGLDADGTVTLAPNAPRTITFVPNPAIAQPTTANLAFFADDGHYRGTDTESVALTVVPAPPNQAPSFVVTSVSQPDSTTGKVTISYTKSDPDGDAVTLSVDPDQLDGNATFVDNGNGTATYTPDRAIVRGIGQGGAPITDAFTIVASDGHGHSVARDVTATVKFTNQKPFAVFEDATVVDESTGEIHGRVTIVDPDGDPAEFTFAATDPSSPPSSTPGTLNFNLATGEYTFIPKTAVRIAQPGQYRNLLVTVEDDYSLTSTGAAVLYIVPVPVVVTPPTVPPTTPPTVPPPNLPGGPGEVLM